ncbi:MAG: bifunctional glutamate N-acetyltransferase/amino-acid acetyltransferase ArgJ [Nitrospirota bacterium]
MIKKNQAITIPGFKFSAVSAGIKKTGAKDLALIFSENITTTAGVFTTNKIKAAPVKLDIKRIVSQKGQAIIINSGNANACTGLQGLKDAKEISETTAKELCILPELVYVSSTGVIGRFLPMQKIKKAIPELVEKLSPYSLTEVSTAIMTTDTFPKMAFKKINIAGKIGAIAGIAKGSGMICPNLATMLSFVVTDIAVEKKALDSALRNAVKNSFNRLIIDNDMSTNDTVLIMANGMLKNKPITKSSSLYPKFKNALTEITYNLAKMIAKDGEGATKLIEIIAKGAKTEGDAEKIAKSIANSMLVKTAIYGNDPNWGRIMAAIGYSGVEINEEKINIYIDKFKLVNKGMGIKKIPNNIFSKKEIVVTVELGLGKKEAKILTCDLTEGYIKINASYMT